MLVKCVPATGRAAGPSESNCIAQCHTGAAVKQAAAWCYHAKVKGFYSGHLLQTDCLSVKVQRVKPCSIAPEDEHVATASTDLSRPDDCLAGTLQVVCLVPAVAAALNAILPSGAVVLSSVYVDVNLVTALVPSDTACFASSPGRMSRTAVCTSRILTSTAGKQRSCAHS